MTEILTKEQASTVHGTECWSERRLEETDERTVGEEPNARPSGRLDPEDRGRRRRAKFVKRARVIAAVGLALAWMVELGGEAVSAAGRSGRREIVKDSMLLDLETDGTTFGVYPSSPGEIISRWTNVMKEDESRWHVEDNIRALNWFVLMLFSGFAGYFFISPGGRALVENYVENGVQT